MTLLRLLENPESLEIQLFVLLVVALAFVLWRVIRARAGRSSGRSATDEPQREDELIARLTDQVTRLESRLENLETILGDKDRPKK